MCRVFASDVSETRQCLELIQLAINLFKGAYLPGWEQGLELSNPRQCSQGWDAKRARDTPQQGTRDCGCGGVLRARTGSSSGGRGAVDQMVECGVGETSLHAGKVKHASQFFV